MKNALSALLLILAVAAGSAPLAAATVVKYDFNSPSADWKLYYGWSLATPPGGPSQALCGKGNGQALLNLPGNVTSLKYKARVEGLSTAFNANVLSYTLVNDTAGVNISSGSTSIGRGFIPLAPRLVHDVEVLVGGGSLDVFIDGEPVVGTDVPKSLPSGTVSFGSWASECTYIDDVVVEFDGPAHSKRAPRPPLTLPPGPDVGSFVKGQFSGDYTLNNQTLVLKTGRYVINQGNFYLKGASKLEIQPNAVLVFDRGTSPLIHWGLEAQGTSVVTIAGQVLPANNALVAFSAFGKTKVEVKNCKPWIHFLNVGDNTQVTIDGSRFVTNMGGSLGLGGSASLTATNSRIGSIGLFLANNCTFHADGLPTGFIAAWDSKTNMYTDNKFYLQLSKVTMEPDTIGPGPFERGWVIFANDTAWVRIRNSTLRKVSFQLTEPASAPTPPLPTVTVSKLPLGVPVTKHLFDTDLVDVRVMGQWAFTVPNYRKAVIEGCEGIWLWLTGNGDVLLRHSGMNEFDARGCTGWLRFDEAAWTVGGEIINQFGSANNNFSVEGTVKISSEVSSLSWDKATVARKFPVRVTAGGVPSPGVTVTWTSPGGKTGTTVTGKGGWATVSLTFTDADYNGKWTLSANGKTATVNFATSTPILLGN